MSGVTRSGNTWQQQQQQHRQSENEDMWMSEGWEFKKKKKGVSCIVGQG